jgi:cobalt-zinc-cadmium efflux system outer membrane protein
LNTVTDALKPPVDLFPAKEEPTSLPARLSLVNCIDLAMRQHPDLVIAAAQIDSARGEQVQAGLYPNPVIAYQGDDMNTPGAGAGKQGAMITQSIVTAGKLRLAADAAGRGVEVADWKAQIKLFDVVTRVRSAYYETLTAQQQVEASKEVLAIAQDAHSSAEKLAKAGVVGQPDVLRAQVELEQSKVALAIAQERLSASWRLLVLALGQPELQVRPLSGSLQDTVPDYRFDDVRSAVLEISAEMQAAKAAIAQAEGALAHAQAEAIPDLQVQVYPFYNQPDRRTELMVGIGAPFPLFNRNQGKIMTARAGVAQANAALKQTELQLAERLAGAFQRYVSARQQVQAYEQKILPAAQESVRVILLAYRSGETKDFNAVLDAQRSLAQARLGFVHARGELQKSVAEIEGMLQRVPAAK